MIIDKENKVAYLKFPSAESEVRRARADGYEIIDELFCPKELKDQGGEVSPSLPVAGDAVGGGKKRKEQQDTVQARESVGDTL